MHLRDARFIRQPDRQQRVGSPYQQLPAISGRLVLRRISIIVDLEDRVQSIERYLKKRDGARLDPPGRVNRDRQVSVVSKSAPSGGATVVDTNVPNDESVDHQAETDGMGISFVNEEDCGYFGTPADDLFFNLLNFYRSIL